MSSVNEDSDVNEQNRRIEEDLVVRATYSQCTVYAMPEYPDAEMFYQPSVATGADGITLYLQEHVCIDMKDKNYIVLPLAIRIWCYGNTQLLLTTAPEFQKAGFILMPQFITPSMPDDPLHVSVIPETSDSLITLAAGIPVATLTAVSQQTIFMIQTTLRRMPRS